MGAMMKKIATVILVLAAILGFFSYVDQSKHWVYDPAMLQTIAQEGIARAKSTHGEQANPSQIIHEVIKGMMQVYPETTRYTGEWMWNNAGGAMGSMTVLHCSFSEYIIIFGTHVGTEGHTGRHIADDYFTILYGEQWVGSTSPAEREVYRPGDQNLLPRWTAKQYRMPDTCWALEYARGNIVSMLFFGYLDGLFSTWDFPTLWQTTMASAGNMIPNILNGKI